MERLKEMKQYVIIISIIFIVTCIIIYLFGCFANADFNISNWEGIDRLFIGFLGIFLSVFVSGLYMINKWKNQL